MTDHASTLLFCLQRLFTEQNFGGVNATIDELGRMSGLEREELLSARKELVELGYIDFAQGGRRDSADSYLLPDRGQQLMTEKVTALEKYLREHPDQARAIEKAVYEELKRHEK